MSLSESDQELNQLLFEALEFLSNRSFDINRKEWDFFWQTHGISVEELKAYKVKLLNEYDFEIEEEAIEKMAQIFCCDPFDLRIALEFSDLWCKKAESQLKPFQVLIYPKRPTHGLRASMESFPDDALKHSRNFRVIGVPSTVEIELRDLWNKTAKSLLEPFQRLIAEKVKAEVFWNKTDRIAIMTAGGAALGSAIALLPGAIIGGLLAATYGGYISFVKPRSERNP